MKTRKGNRTWKKTTLIKMAIMMGLSLTIGLNLMGCKGKPTEDLGKATVLKTIQKQDLAKAIKLLSFRKTNGIVREGPGPKNYEMEFECEIEFTRDCIWAEKTEVSPGGSFFTNQPGFSNCIPVKSGYRAKVISKIEFEKTENGWRETH